MIIMSQVLAQYAYLSCDYPELDPGGLQAEGCSSSVRLESNLSTDVGWARSYGLCSRTVELLLSAPAGQGSSYHVQAEI